MTLDTGSLYVLFAELLSIRYYFLDNLNININSDTLKYPIPIF